MTINMDDRLSGEDLLRFIDQIERLEEEKKNIQEAIKDVYSEASSSGLDPKIMRQLIRLRKMDTEKFREHEVLLAVYKKALGMLISMHEMEEAPL